MGTEKIESISTVNTGKRPAEGQKRINTKVDIGGAMLNIDNKNYGVATAGAGATVNLEKGFSASPKLNAAIGKDVKGIGGELIFAKSLNPQLTLNTGLGYEAIKFNKTTKNETYDVAGGEGVYDMGGEQELRNEGAYIYSGTVSKSDTAKSSQNRFYGTFGADYKVNDKLNLNAGLELGLKNVNGSVHVSEPHITGEYCTQSGSYEYMDDIGEYSYKTGSSKTESFVYDDKTVIKDNSSTFTGNVKLGAEYKLNKKLSAGIIGNIGLNKGSDNSVGGKITYRF